jgi:hypothetical protein
MRYSSVVSAILLFRLHVVSNGNPDISSSTSLSLIDRVRARDAEAWQRLSQLYGPLVYRWARQAGLQANDAIDLAQEVFGAVSAGINNFRHDRPGDTFRGWLWGVTNNKLKVSFGAKLRPRKHSVAPMASCSSMPFRKLRPRTHAKTPGFKPMLHWSIASWNWFGRNSRKKRGRPSGEPRSTDRELLISPTS